MSRSVKKEGIIKDKGCSRAFYNRRFRRVNKYRLRTGKALLQMPEVVNDYTVCDYVLRYEFPASGRGPNKPSVTRQWLAYFGK